MKFLNYFIILFVFFFLLLSQKSVDHLSLGDKYLKQGKISFARDEYEKAVKFNKVSREIVASRIDKLQYLNREDEIHCNAAIEYDKNGQFDLAIKEYEKALRINPQKTKAMQGLMIDLFKAGRDEQALKITEGLVSLAGESPLTLYHRALFDYRKQKYDLCIAKLNRSIALSKSYLPAKELLKTASAKYDEMKAKKSVYAKELFLNGLRYFKNRDFKLAVATFQDSLVNSVPEAFGVIGYGVLEKRLPIIEEYSKIGIYFDLSCANEMIGNFEEAIAALEKINDVKDNQDIILYKIAELYKKSGDDDAAYKYYLKAAGINPSFPNIYSKIAFSAKKLGFYDESISYFKRSIEYDDKNPIHYYNLAIMLKKSEHYTEAGEYFHQAASLVSSSDISLKYLINEQINLINVKLNDKTAKK